MAVLVNFKICDNARECGGIAVCPTGALSYDEEKNTIAIDNEKCISCGLCENECPIGAIMVAKNDEEYQKIKNDIDSDTRTTKDLTKDLPKDTLFYKAEASEEIITEYNVKELPSLLIFRKGDFLGNIDGYYTNDDKNELLEKVNLLLK